MLYTVEEASIQLKVSKQTIYSKIKQSKFKDLLVFKQGKSILTDELLKLINDGLIINKDLNSDAPKKEKKLDNIVADENIKDLINTFNKQLEAKDKQINDLNERFKNSQILQLKQTKTEEKIMLLTDKIRNEQPKKGFISKLFKKAI